MPTIDKLAKFTSETEVGDSSVSDDGAIVNIPVFKFDAVRSDFGNAVAIPAGQNDNWDPGHDETALPVACGFGGSTITGMVPNAHGRGTVVFLANAMPGPPLTIKHMSASSLADNRILCPDERDCVIPSGGAAIMQCMGLSGTGHGWRLLGMASTSFVQSNSQTAVAGRLRIGPPDTDGPIIKGAMITPPALVSGDNHDWNPTGFLAAGRLRVTSAFGGSNLTGMAGVTEGIKPGDVKVLQMFGAVTFKHQDAGSIASRRFYLPSSVALVVPAGGAVTFLYDQNQYWWPIGVAK